jgi:hypothetical protein
MAQTKFKVEDGLLVRGQANLTGNTVIGGNLTLEDDVLTGANFGGALHPTANSEYDLGTSNMRWRRLFANSISTANTIEITGQANLYGGAHFRDDLSFDANNYLVGNTTAMPIIYSTNTFIYDTLRVAGTSGDPYLLANSTLVEIGSNAEFKGETLAINDGLLTMGVVSESPLTISTSSSAPTTLQEFTKAGGTVAVKYFVVAKNNTTNHVQCSTITLMYHADTDTVYISESDIMHSSAAPFVSFAPATTTNLIRLVGYATHASVDITIQRIMLK